MWADQVLQDPLALLSDHAYLERKAASNALDLLNHWPLPGGPNGWVTLISGIVKDEGLHLDAVLKLLERRGGTLQRLHKNVYANDLRALVRKGQDRRETIDRLLVSALIEARSAERFALLADAADEELGKFYRGLWTSEMGHHAVFLELAKRILSSEEVDARWAVMLDEEAKIIQAQTPGPRLHSGLMLQ